MPFILLTIFHACTSEQDYTPENEQKPVEPLTVSSAKDWYEQNFGMTPRLKDADEYNEALTLLPSWATAELFGDSTWYVVESSLEFENKTLRMMTAEVSEYTDLNGGDKSQVKQSTRLMVMRNKETGDTYSFMMMILPSLDYMLEKGDELDENRYLTRNGDFSGQVLYYEVNGNFVNGWIYEDGKITGAMRSAGNSSLGGNRLKELYLVTNSYCWYQYVGYSNSMESALYCEFSHHYVERHEEDLIYAGDGSGGLGGFDFGGGGGGGNSSSPSTDQPKEEPTDPCESMKNKMLSGEFTKAITDLKGLTGKNYEAGRAYTYNNGNYNFTNRDGNPGDPEISYMPEWPSKIDGFIHSHYDGLLKTFSPADLVVPYNWFTYKNGINDMNTFSLGLVTSEGTYFIFVSDWTKYRAFGQTFGDKKGTEILSYMYENDYNITTSTDATTSMNSLIKLLDTLGSGLTLMKDGGNNKFSIVTKDSSGNIKLVNCN